MKSTKAVLIATAFSMFLTGSAMAVTVPEIRGRAVYDGAPDAFAADTRVVACPEPFINAACAFTATDVNGFYSIKEFNVPDEAKIHIFGWTDRASGGRTGRWGSDDVPYTSAIACQYRDQSGRCHNDGVTAGITLIAAPLEPVAIDPAPDAVGVPTGGVTLRWKSSSDEWRQGTTISYAIFGSYNHAALHRQAADLTCKADESGYCEWTAPVSLEVGTNYNWQVIARGEKDGYAYTTESQVYHFTTGKE